MGVAHIADTAGHCRHAEMFGQGNPVAERRTRWVMGLTLVVMVAEIGVGWLFNSMALLADGWHMSSHALALGLAVFAYRMAARYRHDDRFSFGTWKIEILGGYTSALLLVSVAALMLWRSVERLLHPLPIGHDPAIGTAMLGLLVNLLSAWLLKDGDHLHHDHSHSHSHSHGHEHEHGGGGDHLEAGGHGHADLNLRAAYIHVLADAATSILAIVALFGGKWWGADWLDPLMGMVGAVLVAVWARGLLVDCARVLLDAEMDAPVVGKIRAVLAGLAVPLQLDDLHVWRVAHDRHACIVALSLPAQAGGDAGLGEASAATVTNPQEAALPTADEIRQRLAGIPSLVHVTVELNRA